MSKGISKREAKIQALRVIYTCTLDCMERGRYDFEALGFSLDDAVKIEHCVNALLSDIRFKYEKLSGSEID